MPSPPASQPAPQRPEFPPQQQPWQVAGGPAPPQRPWPGPPPTGGPTPPKPPLSGAVAQLARWPILGVAVVLAAALIGLSAADQSSDSVVNTGRFTTAALLALLVILPAGLITLAVGLVGRGRPLARGLLWVGTPVYLLLLLFVAGIIVRRMLDSEATAGVVVAGGLSVVLAVLLVILLLALTVTLALPGARQQAKASAAERNDTMVSAARGATALRATLTLLGVSLASLVAAGVLWVVGHVQLYSIANANARESSFEPLAGLFLLTTPALVSVAVFLLGTLLARALGSWALRAVTCGFGALAVGVGTAWLVAGLLVLAQFDPSGLYEDSVGPGWASWGGYGLNVLAFVVFASALVGFASPAISTWLADRQQARSRIPAPVPGQGS